MAKARTAAAVKTLKSAEPIYAEFTTNEKKRLLVTTVGGHLAIVSEMSDAVTRVQVDGTSHILQGSYEETIAVLHDAQAPAAEPVEPAPDA